MPEHDQADAELREIRERLRRGHTARDLAELARPPARGEAAAGAEARGGGEAGELDRSAAGATREGPQGTPPGGPVGGGPARGLESRLLETAAYCLYRLELGPPRYDCVPVDSFDEINAADKEFLLSAVRQAFRREMDVRYPRLTVPAAWRPVIERALVVSASGSPDGWCTYRRVATVEARVLRAQEAVPSYVQVPRGHSPRPGDYIVRDPEKLEDVWLVRREDFERWYEAVR